MVEPEIVVWHQCDEALQLWFFAWSLPDSSALHWKNPRNSQYMYHLTFNVTSNFYRLILSFQTSRSEKVVFLHVLTIYSTATCELIFFQMRQILMDFEPSRVFVEYLVQFPSATSKNRTVGFTLKIYIDRYSNCHKKVEFVIFWLSERTLFSDVAQCSWNYMAPLDTYFE